MQRIIASLVTGIWLTCSAGVALAAGKLSIYHWFEYIPQELLDKFAAEHDVEVTMDTYDSNEAMLAALKAGAIGQYDVAVPGDFMVKIMADEGLLGDIASGELKNFANIEEHWVDVDFDPGRKHSIPYQWGSTSFSVNREVYSGDIDTTAIIFEPPDELKGKVNVLDAQGEVLGLASIHLGIPQCTTDRDQLKALDALMQSAKQHWASFNSDGAKDVLVSGDAAAGMIWNGFGAKARGEGAPIEYAYPKEGYIAWMDKRGPPEGSAEPGERGSVHGLPARAGEHRRGDELRAVHRRGKGCRSAARLRSAQLARAEPRPPTHRPARSSRRATKPRRRCTIGSGHV